MTLEDKSVTNSYIYLNKQLEETNHKIDLQVEKNQRSWFCCLLKLERYAELHIHKNVLCWSAYSKFKNIYNILLQNERD